MFIIWLFIFLLHTRNVYCAIWTESTMGGSAIDIANALYKILEQILTDHLNLTKLI